MSGAASDAERRTDFSGDVIPRANDLIFHATVFVATFVVATVCMDRSLSLYDEGLILTGAARVADGALPHRDFYANYGPGQFYFLAALFKLFGPSVLVERIWDLVVKAGVVCLASIVASRLMPRVYVATVGGICIVWIAALGTPGYPMWPSMFFILLGVPLLNSVLDGNYLVGRLVAAGIIVGVVVVFRYDMGFFACAAESAVLLAYGLRGPRLEGSSLRRTGALLLPFWAGTALVFIPLALVYAMTGTIADFFFQIVQFPSRHYAEMRALPFPGPWMDLDQQLLTDFIVYLPVLVVAACMIALCSGGSAASPARNGQTASEWPLLLITALSLVLYFKGLVRTSAIHMAPSIIPAIVALGAVAARSFGAKSTAASKATATLAILAIVLLAITSAAALMDLTRGAGANLAALADGRIINFSKDRLKSPPGSCDPPVELRRMRCFLLSESAARTVAFVHANTEPDEAIFIGTGRHDKLLINDIALYFVVDRPPATKWHHFDPGLQTSRSIQEQMIDDFSKRAPKLVVLDSQWDNVIEPNKSAISSGVGTLDDYISEKFEPAAEFGPYRVLRPRLGKARR